MVELAGGGSAINRATPSSLNKKNILVQSTQTCHLSGVAAIPHPHLCDLLCPRVTEPLLLEPLRNAHHSSAGSWTGLGRRRSRRSRSRSRRRGRMNRRSRRRSRRGRMNRRGRRRSDKEILLPCRFLVFCPISCPSRPNYSTR